VRRRRRSRRWPPSCFGSSDVEAVDGQYRMKCLMCSFEDKCRKVHENWPEGHPFLKLEGRTFTLDDFRKIR